MRTFLALFVLFGLTAEVCRADGLSWTQQPPAEVTPGTTYTVAGTNQFTASAGGSVQVTVRIFKDGAPVTTYVGTSGTGVRVTSPATIQSTDFGEDVLILWQLEGLAGYLPPNFGGGSPLWSQAQPTYLSATTRVRTTPLPPDPPTFTPTLEWSVTKAVVNIHEGFQIRARAHDDQGQITYISVWCEDSTVPPQSASSSPTTDLETPGTPLFQARATPGTMVFHARAKNANNIYSAELPPFTVQVGDFHFPTISWLGTPPATAIINQPIVIQAHGADVDGDLIKVQVWEGSLLSSSPQIKTADSAPTTSLDSPADPFVFTTTGLHTISAWSRDATTRDATPISYDILVKLPNNAPTITWVQAPTTAAINQPFTVQAVGQDSDGNITNIKVSRGGIEVDSNHGTGSQVSSHPLTYAQGFAGTVEYSAIATDADGAKSAPSPHTVTVGGGSVAVDGGGDLPGQGSWSESPRSAGGTTLVGSLGGGVSVDNKGAANYAIPLVVPPGRGGLEPKLSLNYNSGGGNGPLGLGFSLSTGFPQSITRGRTILARDGIVRGVTFTSNDKFYLDGKRLIWVGGSPEGQPGSSYRTEVDSFVTITTAGGSTIDTFTVTDKAGTKMIFGKYGSTTDGYQPGILRNGASASWDSLAYAWALKRVEDALGNSVDFSYQSDALKGEFVITQIDYTANVAQSVAAHSRVQFNYYSDRNDRTSSYISGRRFAREKRLDNIVASTFDAGSWTDRAKYVLAYQYSQDTGRLQMKFVNGYLWDEVAAVMVPLPSTAFSWSNYDQSNLATFPISTIGPSGFSSSNAGYRFRSFGDFNGDGKEDYIDAKDSAGLAVYLSTGSTVSGQQFQKQIWLPAASFPADFPSSNIAADVNGWGILTLDLNGDGKKDLLLVRNGPVRVQALISTGSSFQVANLVDLSPAVGRYIFDTLPGNPEQNDLSFLRVQVLGGLFGRFSSGDFYGNGSEQMLVHGYDGYRYLLKWDRATSQLALTSPMNPGAPGNKPSVSTWRAGAMWDMRIITSIDYPMDMVPQPADMNGDGITDYIWGEKTSRIGTTGQFDHTVTKWWYSSLSNGAGGGNPAVPPYFFGKGSFSLFVPLPQNSIDFVENYTQMFMPGDFNGDGITDFVARNTDGWQLRINQGAIAVAGDPMFDLVSGLPKTFTAPNGDILYTVSRFMPKTDWDTRFQRGVSDGPQSSDARILARIQSDSSANTLVIDVNHDGLSDLVWFVEYRKLNSDPSDARDTLVSAENKGWWVALSNGHGFAAPKKLAGGIWNAFATLPQGYAGGTMIAAALAQPDLNGDGLSDWVASSGSGDLVPAFYAYSVGTFGDLLNGVTNSVGRHTDIAYKAAKDDSLYTPGAAVNYPIRDLRSSAPVVSDVWQDSGANGTPAQFSYQYSGRRLDLSGRGDLGFHSFVTVDRQTNLLKYQFLVQSFPMTGLTHREETYRFWAPGNFRFISSHDNVVVFDEVANGATSYGTLYPFISQAIESRWEDSATAHFSLGAATSTAQPEVLFPLAKPSGAHIVITAQSWFDEQSLASSPQLTLPGVSGFQPSDLNGSGQNVVSGTTSFAVFDSLPRKITYGNLRRLKTDFGGGFSETVTTAYKPPSGVLTGLADTVTTSVTSPGYDPETAPVKRFNYVAGTPLVSDETIDAADDALDLKTTYARDSLGRVTGTTLANTSATGLQAIGTYSVGTVTAFDNRFDSPTTTKNAAPYQHTTTTAYHAFFGQPTSVTDVNGAQVTTEYDPFGRTVKVRDELKGLQTTTSFTWDASQTVSPPAGVGGIAITSVYRVQTATTLQPTVTSYYDRLGRIIRTVKDGFNGQQIVSDTVYNVLGQVVATSRPYLSGNTPLWTKTTYDPLGRVVSVTAPNGTVTTNTYQGRATLVTVNAPDLGGRDPAAQTNATLVDAKGRTVKVWNADNVPTFDDNVGTTSTAASIAFGLDGFGRMRSTTLLGQSSQPVLATYDELGRQISLTDPDKGAWVYLNNALGQVVRQTDANGNVTTSTFDHLGRPLDRTTVGSGVTETAGFYYYDATENTTLHLVAKGTQGWIGAPQREVADTTGAPAFDAPATVNLHYYDAKGRSLLELAQLDNQWFYTYTDYDAYSRPNVVRHYWRPVGHESATDLPYLWESFGYVYAYDTRSYLLSITDLIPTGALNRVWWDSPTYDLLDRVTSVRKGSGHTTTRTYRPTDGVLTAIKTGPTAGSSQIQNLSFGFDGLGNLTSRAGAGNSETYDYDILNRLVSRNGGVVASYAANGNITSKMDVAGVASGSYAYAGTRPHAATSAWGYTMGYDANGNLQTRSKSGETWNLNWTGFDKPRWMAKTAGTTTVGSEFHYNAARSRVMQLEFDAMSASGPSHYTRKRLYGLGATLEANYTNSAPNGAPTWSLDNVRIYVPGPDGMIGAREFSPLKPLAQQEKALVYHYDHLGSIESITPFGTTVVAYAADSGGKSGLFSEDAWGQRRNPNTWSGAPTTTDDGGADSLTPRGFTGHEMLDDLGLVHMNGRIYDPLLGRFLSADVFVSTPGELQSYNRYSYVRNNPLALVDPTGFADDVPLWRRLFLDQMHDKAPDNLDANSPQPQKSDQVDGGPSTRDRDFHGAVVGLHEVNRELNAMPTAFAAGAAKFAADFAAEAAETGAGPANFVVKPLLESAREGLHQIINSTATDRIVAQDGNPDGIGRAFGEAGGYTVAFGVSLVAPFAAEATMETRVASVGGRIAAESRLVTSGGAADAFQYSQLKAALRLEQSMGNGKFVTNAALELGETRIAVFDQASGKMFIGRPGAMGHIDVVAEHGLTAGDSLIGGAIRVTEGGQMQFLPVSGSFPLPAANATGALNAVRGTGVSIIGGPK